LAQTKSLDPALHHPLRGEFLALLGAVEKIKIERLLVRRTCPGMVTEEKRDFSHPQADAFAGANAEEKVGLLRSK
jgi:hypothetical protein